MAILTLKTYIRQLPHRVFVKLSLLLDPGNLWEKMAMMIPMKLEEIGQENAEARYSHQHIEVFAFMGRKPGNSPAQSVLKDWSMKNATVEHLIKILMKAELIAAAEYLHNDILKLGALQNTNVEGLAMSEAESIQNGILTRSLEDLDSVETTLRMDKLSVFSSPENYILPEAGVQQSECQRQPVLSKGDFEEDWIDLSAIEIQTISYAMLLSLTDNFNEEPKEEGGNLIGSGGFGKVYLGKFRNGFSVAVKCLMRSDQVKKEELNLLIKQFENEVKMLSKYRHENVVHLLGYSIDGPAQCLVYQYLINGSLEDCLQRHKETPLSASLRLKIVKGTAKGIQFLNDQGHVHRDIKSANILLDSEFTAKVGDFATVMSAPSGDSRTVAKATSVIGTPAYLAPEAVQFDVSTKLDSYSFGVVLLEVITGLPSHDENREEKTLAVHIKENVEEPSQIHELVDQTAGSWEEGVIDKLYDISMRCLTLVKKHRPNVKDFQAELQNL